LGFQNLLLAFDPCISDVVLDPLAELTPTVFRSERSADAGRELAEYRSEVRRTEYLHLVRDVQAEVVIEVYAIVTAGLRLG
jgi:hypothetical protein